MQRLKTLVSRLLLLAQADSAQMPLTRSAMDLVPLLRGLAEDFADDDALTLEINLPDALPVYGDAHMLTLCLSNLLRNAVKYNRTDGRIAISATASEAVEVRIFNTGEIIPDELRERIFERFYRIDKVRGRQSGGSGLGLSLAREIALAHGGSLHAESGGPEGNVFVLRLPCFNR